MLHRRPRDRDASRMIALGDADVMVAGGAEAAVCRLGLAGFAAARGHCRRISTRRQSGLRALGRRPGRLRHGRGRWRPGPGRAGACARSRRQDLRRGRRLRSLGRRLSITAPSPDGDGGYRSMAAALRRAGLRPRPSTTSMRTAPPRRSATKSSSARSSGCSARRPGTSPCRQPNRRSVTCSVRPAAWKRFFHCLPSIIRSCRRP